MSFRDLQLQSFVKKNEVNIKKPDFAEVIKINKGKISVKLLQKPGSYADINFIGNYTPTVGDKGVLFFIGGANYPVFDAFSRNLSNKPGEWSQNTPNRVKSNYPYIPLFNGVLKNLTEYYGRFKTNPENATIQQIMDLYDTLGKQYGIDPNMLIAQAWQESGFTPGIPSRAGAVGWSQFMPGTWPDYAPKGFTDKSYRNHILKSIQAQFKYMARLLNIEKGDMYFALRGYNGGEGWRKRWENAISGENYEYAPKIFFHYDILKTNQFLYSDKHPGTVNWKPYIKNTTATSFNATSNGLLHFQSFT